MASARLDGKQRDMLQLRFDVLDTYVKRAVVTVSSWFKDGRLVIVDLTDAFVDRKCNIRVVLQVLNICQVLLPPSYSILFWVSTSVTKHNLGS